MRSSTLTQRQSDNELTKW